ncbi:MAG: PIN domain-containing protein [Desulfococcaceae bacterium]
MIKKTVYLDTTIPSYYFDEREKVKFQSEITKKWFSEEADKYQIYLSEATLGELNAGNYPNKEKIMEFSLRFEVLPTEKQIADITENYIQNYVMPKDRQGDALHLAFASYYKIDFLLTWNCNNLSNANKKQHIRIINTRMNLSIPEIITPLQLFSETGRE